MYPCQRLSTCRQKNLVIITDVVYLIYRKKSGCDRVRKRSAPSSLSIGSVNHCLPRLGTKSRELVLFLAGLCGLALICYGLFRELPLNEEELLLTGKWVGFKELTNGQKFGYFVHRRPNRTDLTLFHSYESDVARRYREQYRTGVWKVSHGILRHHSWWLERPPSFLDRVRNSLPFLRGETMEYFDQYEIVFINENSHLFRHLSTGELYHFRRISGDFVFPETFPATATEKDIEHGMRQIVPAQ